MQPDEVELVQIAVMGRIRSVKTAFDVLGAALDAEFGANIRACPAATHGVEDSSRFEVAQQVAYQQA
jgi:hypothetical protein